MKARYVEPSLRISITITDRERISRWGRTRPSHDPFSRCRWVLEIVWGGECVEQGGCGEDWTWITWKKRSWRIFAESRLCQEVKAELAPVGRMAHTGVSARARAGGRRMWMPGQERWE